MYDDVYQLYHETLHYTKRLYKNLQQENIPLTIILDNIHQLNENHEALASMNEEFTSLTIIYQDTIEVLKEDKEK